MKTLTAAAFFCFVFVMAGHQASGETLADYAKIKAPCRFNCTRDTLRLSPPLNLMPQQGAVFEASGGMSLTADWKIIDFGKGMAFVVETKGVRNPQGGFTETILGKSEMRLDEQQLSTAIALSNTVWNPPPSPPANFSPRCTDAGYEFVLLDGDRVHRALSLCGFRNDAMFGSHVEEAKLETWFDAIAPRRP
jgi:hypothetical protein